MERIYFRLLLLSLLAFPAWIPAIAMPATILSQEEIGKAVAVRDVTVKNGAVSGEIVNQSSRPIRDVQLLIRYSWRWKNEFKPGTDDLSRAYYHTIDREIPPGGRASFVFMPTSPLPSRPEGFYEVSVAVAGFTEIIVP
jgi:hypothetical protein